MLSLGTSGCALLCAALLQLILSHAYPQRQLDRSQQIAQHAAIEAFTGPPAATTTPAPGQGIGQALNARSLTVPNASADSIMLPGLTYTTVTTTWDYATLTYSWPSTTSTITRALTTAYAMPVNPSPSNSTTSPTTTSQKMTTFTITDGVSQVFTLPAWPTTLSIPPLTPQSSVVLPSQSVSVLTLTVTKSVSGAVATSPLSGVVNSKTAPASQSTAAPTISISTAKVTLSILVTAQSSDAIDQLHLPSPTPESMATASFTMIMSEPESKKTATSHISAAAPRRRRCARFKGQAESRSSAGNCLDDKLDVRDDVDNYGKPRTRTHIRDSLGAFNQQGGCVQTELVRDAQNQYILSAACPPQPGTFPQLGYLYLHDCIGISEAEGILFWYPLS